MVTIAEPGTGQRTVWQIDPRHTLLEFAVRHMMLSTVKGRFGGVRGDILLDDSDVSRSSVTVEVDAASIDTRDAQRDTHLRSHDFLDVAKHPALMFESTRIDEIGKDRLQVTGDLTIRGVTREVVLDATINGRGRTPGGEVVAAFTAETTISREQFGLMWNAPLETGGVLVGDAVRILIEVEALKEH